MFICLANLGIPGENVNESGVALLVDNGLMSRAAFCPTGTWFQYIPENAAHAGAIIRAK